MLENKIPIFGSQEISPSLISFEMIFEAPQSGLFRFKFNSLRSNILKIPEFNLSMSQNYIFDFQPIWRNAWVGRRRV